MKKVSFIFPIYKESPYVLENISKILSDPYPSELKEIIIAVDCPTEEFLEKLKEIKHLKNVKLLISSERRGKVAATNIAASYSSGDILIFIDSDARIVNINLKKVLEDLEKSDIVEFYKYVKPTSFWNKLYALEWVIYMELIVPLFSKSGNIFLNGAGFAVKKKVWQDLGGYARVIVEDVDFAIRAYKRGYLTCLSKNIVVETAPLESFRRWIDQRKRWISGGLEVFLYHLRVLISYFLNRPLELPFVIALNPWIVFFLFTLYVPYMFFYSLSKAIYVGIVENLSIFYIFVFSPFLVYKILVYLYYFLLFVLSFSIVIFISLLIKKKIVGIHYVIGFVGIYSLLEAFIIIYILLYYIIFEGFPRFNWKV
ncbi:MAG: hypothetical protein BXU00_02975 [Candidatus Nanoclepta minutus]|uniref:Glycosyltransferase 2-like domain-containing protein n=1 Tax=Candidatus Nanoclepta minutus TaxID=1940235 RepID=A0A397WNH5_9ARCH|nr:MAG: hypothetical protein BXU00_02975 [Candidatus Nanoclepta minutus]